MEKPKKVRKELSRLQRFLAREVERLEAFLGHQGERAPLADSQLTPFMPALAERRRLAAADLAQVTTSLERLEDHIARKRKARKAAASTDAQAESGTATTARKSDTPNDVATSPKKPAASRSKTPDPVSPDAKPDDGKARASRKPAPRKAAAQKAAGSTS